MKNKSNIFLISILVILLFLIFKNWIVAHTIIGGDWPYYFNETLKSFPFPLPAWSPLRGNGLGGLEVDYPLETYKNFTVFFSTNSFVPWMIVYKILWFGFFICLSIFSTIYLAKLVFKKTSLWQVLIAALIYTTNTYILLVVGGGQIGYALAYGMVPFALGTFITLINFVRNLQQEFKIQNSKFKIIIQNVKVLKYSIISGIMFAILVMFDIRVAYILILAVFLYLLLNITYKLSKNNILNSCFLILTSVVIPLGITTLLHAFWLLPFLVFHQNPTASLGSAYTSTSSLQFFSFAQFSNAMGLLHPNWSENIFGKIGFMKPEFLLLPIVAYTGILFIRNPKSQIPNPKSPQMRDPAAAGQIQKLNKNNIFFALLGLIGVFLAKGTNEPFGGIFIWLFSHVPGFILFRDPTKFYIFIALAYSMLIPFSLQVIVNFQLSIFNFKLKSDTTCYILLATFLFIWVFTVRQAVFGQLGGTFALSTVPNEYVQFKDYINNQPQFFRTLWIPRQQRFSFYSNSHPSSEAGPLFNVVTPLDVVRKLSLPATKKYISDIGVKYIIVPSDPSGEIFQKNRKYDNVQYNNVVVNLRKISWIHEVTHFEKIVVFENSTYKDHMWLNTNHGHVSYTYNRPTQYTFTLSTTKSTTLIFAENYNPSWILHENGKTIHSPKTKENLNSFYFSKPGNYHGEIIFTQDKYYMYGRIISLITISILGILFLVLQ